MELSELDKVQKAIFVQRWLREELKSQKPEGKSWTEYIAEQFQLTKNQ
jgi:hypothetical protein